MPQFNVIVNIALYFKAGKILMFLVKLLLPQEALPGLENFHFSLPRQATY